MLNLLRIILNQYWRHRKGYQIEVARAICDLSSLFLPRLYSKGSRSKGYILACAREDFVLHLFGGECILSAQPNLHWMLIDFLQRKYHSGIRKTKRMRTGI